MRIISNVLLLLLFAHQGRLRWLVHSQFSMVQYYFLSRVLVNHDALWLLTEQTLLAYFLLEACVFSVYKLLSAEHIVCLRRRSIDLGHAVDDFSLLLRYHVLMFLLVVENVFLRTVLLHARIPRDLHRLMLFMVLSVTELLCNVEAARFRRQTLLVFKVTNLARAQRFKCQLRLVVIQCWSGAFDVRVRNAKECVPIFSFIISWFNLWWV